MGRHGGEDKEHDGMIRTHRHEGITTNIAKNIYVTGCSNCEFILGTFI